MPRKSLKKQKPPSKKKTAFARPDFLGSEFSLPRSEESVLNFWNEYKIFEKSVAKNKKGKEFVFFEGPPTANGRPGVHHILSRAFKDAIPRYKTMRGFYVPRKGGWDTHGLPVEIQVEKQLGLKSKKEIEHYGVAEFNKKCRESVWEFKDEWERMTKRMGFWLDMKDPYITYEAEYMETLWWIIAQFWRKGFLYKGHRVVPWCTRCGTALSSHELAQGYKMDEDNSIYVKFHLKPGQKFGK
jgi:isoleucyl-tRNA synthetase